MHCHHLKTKTKKHRPIRLGVPWRTVLTEWDWLPSIPRPSSHPCKTGRWAYRLFVSTCPLPLRVFINLHGGHFAKSSHILVIRNRVSPGRDHWLLCMYLPSLCQHPATKSESLESIKCVRHTCAYLLWQTGHDGSDQPVEPWRERSSYRVH
jgi:hypothetical protein